MAASEALYLNVMIGDKSQRRYPQNMVGKCPLKTVNIMLLKSLPRFKIIIKPFSAPFTLQCFVWLSWRFNSWGKKSINNCNHAMLIYSGFEVDCTPLNFTCIGLKTRCPHFRNSGVPVSLFPRHQILRVRPAALLKNRVWTHSLVKLRRNHTSVSACCCTNQIFQVK